MIIFTLKQIRYLHSEKLFLGTIVVLYKTYDDEMNSCPYYCEFELPVPDDIQLQK